MFSLDIICSWVIHNESHNVPELILDGFELVPTCSLFEDQDYTLEPTNMTQQW
jgi:hypothetical protein